MPTEYNTIGVRLLVFGIDQALFNIGRATAVYPVAWTAAHRSDRAPAHGQLDPSN
jgi:hypothetical protein